MPYAFHSDPEKKWRHQYQTTKKHILPFILQYHNLPADARILELGCGEGGVLKAFSDNGYICFGIDLSESRIEHGEQLLREEVCKKQIRLYVGDVHDTELFRHLYGEIDLIILKDALEHIYDQERILNVLHAFLKRDGAVFLAFPPWFNPFGGHQQLAGSLLRYVPWFHILPRNIYRAVLKLFGETETKIKGLMDICDTRLHTSKFEKLLLKTNWRIRKRQFYLFNPAYEFKFGIGGRKQSAVISHIPVLRDFFSTAVYYLVVA